MRLRNRATAEALVRAHYDEIFAYVLKQTHHRETALDLTQDIFVSMLRSVDGFDDKRASIRTFLYRVATNRIIDHVRSAAHRYDRNCIPLDDLALADDHDFVTALEDQQTAERILAVADALPIELQSVFRLKLLAGQGFREISDSLGIPEPTAKTRYYTAVRRIRSTMQEESKC